MTTKRERKALAKKVRAAADYVERVGLYKGDFFDRKQAKRKGVDLGHGSTPYQSAVEGGVRCCTLGALHGHQASSVAGELEFYLAEVHPKVARWAVIDGRPAAEIPAWNDKKSRRKKDVVEFLRGFADKLEKE